MLDATAVYNLPDRLPSIEAITLKKRSLTGNSDSTFTNYSVPEAQRLPAHKEYQEGKVISTIWWELFKRGLDNSTPPGAPAPGKSDELVDSAGVTYVIDTVQEAKLFGTVWRCWCRVAVPVVDIPGG